MFHNPLKKKLTVKFLNFGTLENFAVIILKMEKEVLPLSTGAFGRAIFLWQRLIVTETMIKYLRSHTTKKNCQRIFVNVSFVLHALQKAEGVCHIQHL